MKKLFSLFVVVMLVLGCTGLFAKIQVGEEVLEVSECSHPYPGVEGVVFEKTFNYPYAGYIALHFSSFELADGDVLEVSNPDGTIVYQYTGNGKVVGDGPVPVTISEFWATHIPGDTAIVKLISNNTNNAFGFVIDKWARGYARGQIEALLAGEEDAQLEAICGTDDKKWAKCYEDSVMYDKARTVCRLLIAGTSACTGWLLGSEGHVMTNHHCIGTQDEANNTDYEFMAEGATCTTDCSSWGACPGIVEASYGNLVKTDYNLDYSLILLPTNITSTYGYLQFRDTLPTIGEKIYIPQHPGAYGKQLALASDTDGPFAKIYSTNEPPCIGGPGDIGYYADTAGGSSGSPVLALDDNYVVALHHCANCPNRGLPIPSIITHLDTDIPNDAIGSGAPQAPEAYFAADSQLVVIGGSANFTDLSSYNPTSWSWTFEGGTPAASTDQNPTVTYNSLGTYSVTLTVTNSQGSDTLTRAGYITVTDVPPYCASQGNNYNYEWIAGVQVGDFSNTSGAAGYTDFTYLVATLYAGTNANVVLTPGYSGYPYTEHWKIWIDFNKDGDFYDSGEELFYGVGNAPVTGSFLVPASALGVTTRMRVSMKWNSAPTPCETFSYGEVEDYTVYISAPQAPIADFTADNTTIVKGESVHFTDLSLNGPTSWSWTFEGGTPATSTDQNPIVTYNEIGIYTVSLTVSNVAGSDTETKTGYITVNPPPLVFETGVLTGVGSTWQTVPLQNIYSSMVVVCSNDLGDSDYPAVTRVRNAEGNSFEVRVQNPSGAVLSGYTVHYIVVEEGYYTADYHGVQMEAQKVISQVTARAKWWKTDVREERSYINTYTNPVVLGQVMTHNDPDWSVFWACNYKVTSPPTPTSFYAGKHVGEDADYTRESETIGFIVIEQGEGLMNGIPYAAAVGPASIRGFDGKQHGGTYTFNEVPNASTAIVSVAGFNDDEGGWPELYGADFLTPMSLTLVFDEDQITDFERKHAKEQVAYLIIGQ
ncbi:MAG: PKD domain-containing protein [Candidatus Aminicenantes bacterium]|nr:PKD domain-containing protein [Candidatus Aminicenantes bacterium]NIM80043.1 PKD domain-containing protein [Candidatus Aminicenantes bacterium]NIN19386.1 PKD domain-containing protein [Candidatus Aminicenantes bacterium]NIN43285.1 PKD domain-containing protein [Candidatus Aminicenantes bacterium]NIN86029.1 PKD domain-containing protein [Candidatus Aminicenantes bacterium]